MVAGQALMTVQEAGAWEQEFRIRGETVQSHTAAAHTGPRLAPLLVDASRKT